MKIKAFLRDLSKMPHMTLAGSVGFDIFEYQNGKEIYKIYQGVNVIMNTYKLVNKFALILSLSITSST